MAADDLVMQGAKVSAVMILREDSSLSKRQAYVNRAANRYGISVFIPPPNEVGGGVYWIHLVRLSVCLSVDDMVSGA